jgi:hypothetical protein
MNWLGICLDTPKFTDSAWSRIIGDSLSRVWYNLIRRRVRPGEGWGRTEVPNAFQSLGARMSKPTRADWPLLALHAAEDGVLTPVQMQKVLFLLDKQAHELLGAGFYRFEAYNYGPFASQIYSDLNEHARDGKIIFDEAPGKTWNKYVITPLGEVRVAEVIDSVEDNLIEYLEVIVAWAKSLRFSELVGAIYKAYPTYAKNSIFSR